MSVLQSSLRKWVLIFDNLNVVRVARYAVQDSCCLTSNRKDLGGVIAPPYRLQREFGTIGFNRRQRRFSTPVKGLKRLKETRFRDGIPPKIRLCTPLNASREGEGAGALK